MPALQLVSTGETRMNELFDRYGTQVIGGVGKRDFPPVRRDR
mgnify:CR=1 FL=1